MPEVSKASNIFLQLFSMFHIVFPIFPHFEPLPPHLAAPFLQLRLQLRARRGRHGCGAGEAQARRRRGSCGRGRSGRGDGAALLSWAVAGGGQGLSSSSWGYPNSWLVYDGTSLKWAPPWKALIGGFEGKMMETCGLHLVNIRWFFAQGALQKKKIGFQPKLSWNLNQYLWGLNCWIHRFRMLSWTSAKTNLRTMKSLL